MPGPFPLVLSDDHVARVAPAEGLLHDPCGRMLEDDDLDLLAQRLTEGRPRPIPVFAYGSLIWNPGGAAPSDASGAPGSRPGAPVHRHSAGNAATSG